MAGQICQQFVGGGFDSVGRGGLALDEFGEHVTDEFGTGRLRDQRRHCRHLDRAVFDQRGAESEARKRVRVRIEQLCLVGGQFESDWLCEGLCRRLTGERLAQALVVDALVGGGSPS